MDMKTELASRLQWDPSDNKEGYKIFCDREGAAKVVADALGVLTEDVLKYTVPMDWLVAAWTDDGFSFIEEAIADRQKTEQYTCDCKVMKGYTVLQSVWSYIVDNSIEDKRA